MSENFKLGEAREIMEETGDDSVSNTLETMRNRKEKKKLTLDEIIKRDYQKSRNRLTSLHNNICEFSSDYTKFHDEYFDRRKIIEIKLNKIDEELDFVLDLIKQVREQIEPELKI